MTARQQLVQWVEESSGFDDVQIDKALKAIEKFTDERCATVMAMSDPRRLIEVIAEGVFWPAPCYAPPLQLHDYGTPALPPTCARQLTRASALGGPVRFGSISFCNRTCTQCVHSRISSSSSSRSAGAAVNGSKQRWCTSILRAVLIRLSGLSTWFLSGFGGILL